MPTPDRLSAGAETFPPYLVGVLWHVMQDGVALVSLESDHIEAPHIEAD